MKRLIAALVTMAVVTFGLAWLPVFADTPGVSPTCFPQSENPHPTAPAGQTTDTLFCAGSGGGSGGSGSHGTGQTAINAGTGAGNSGTTTAAGSRSGSGQTLAGAGSQAHSAKSASGGFFGGLVAFLGAAGGLGYLLGFLLLLVIVLFIVAVSLWLTRRGGGSLASRFARIAHRR